MLSRSFYHSRSQIYRFKDVFQQRSLFCHTQSATEMKVTESADLVREIDIPVPWGNVAARHWNAGANRKPVLCIHGWKDNAATWDRLFPLLITEVPEYEFIAIDLPGHGQSSHFPPGMIYDVKDMWLLFHRIKRHFDWDRMSFIGHSLGAQLSFLYTGTHFDVVERLIAIDALSPVVLNREETLDLIPKLTRDVLSFEQKLATKKSPEYTYDEIVDKLVKTHVGGLDAESCKILMSRGVKETSPGSGKYRFTHDIRVHYLPISGLSSQQVAFIAQNFRSDVLHIKATDGVNYTRPFIKSRMEQWLSSNPESDHVVRFVELDGSHHLHLSTPQTILPVVARFLKRGLPEN